MGEDGGPVVLDAHHRPRTLFRPLQRLLGAGDVGKLAIGVIMPDQEPEGGAAWLASFGCSGAGLTWVEDDEIRIGKDGWTLEAKIKNVRRVGDPIRYCLGSNKC